MITFSVHIHTNIVFFCKICGVLTTLASISVPLEQAGQYKGIICAASLLFAAYGLCHFPAKNANLPQIDCAASQLWRPTGQRIAHNREEN